MYIIELWLSISELWIPIPELRISIIKLWISIVRGFIRIWLSICWAPYLAHICSVATTVLPLSHLIYFLTSLMLTTSYWIQNNRKKAKIVFRLWSHERHPINLTLMDELWVVFSGLFESKRLWDIGDALYWFRYMNLTRWCAKTIIQNNLIIVFFTSRSWKPDWFQHNGYWITFVMV